MKKKLLTVLLAASAVIAGAFGLSACSHTHSFSDTVIEPTCAGPGYTLHSCDCGYSYTDSFKNSVSHTFTREAAEDKYLKTAANCSAKAVYYISCAECGEKGTDTFEYGNLGGHTEAVDKAVTPTCTEKGKTEGKHCSVCSTVLVEQTEIETTAHTFTNELAEAKYLVSEATCIQKAVYYKSCVDCGETGTDTFEHGNLGGHTEVIDEAVAPSCTEGKTEGKHCSVCSTVLVEQTAIPATGKHNWGDNVCLSCDLDAGGSKGMEWILNKNETEYYVKDYGNCKDTAVIIPSVYNGLPVTKICEYAFAEPKITSVKIGDNVSVIENYAFENCTNLKKITIPDNVTDIGVSLFEDCYELTDVIIGNGITSISKDTFWCCKKLANVTFGDNVAYIGACAFGNCDALTEMTIPNSVTAIDEGAFQACSNLKIFIFPDDIKVIDYYVLFESGVTEITVPAGVTKIEPHALLDCVDLEVINYKGTMAQWKAIVINKAWEDNMRDFVIKCTDGTLDKDGNDIALKNITRLTYELSEDGKYYIATGIAEDCTTLDIIIPDYENGLPVEQIGRYFLYADKEEMLQEVKINSIVLGKHVNKIFTSYTLNINSLKNIEVDEENETYSSIDGNLYSKDGKTLIKYPNGKTETAFTVPAKVTAIGNAAFQLAPLTSVTLGENVTDIGSTSFNASKITSINIPKNVISIERHAFLSCTELRSFNVDEDNKYYASIDGNLYSKDGETFIQYAIAKDQTSFNLPNSVKVIGESSFCGSSNLQSVRLPEGLREIGDSAFRGCSSLINITLPDSINFIGERAFASCPQELFTIETGVRYIGNVTNKYFAAVQISTNLSTIPIHTDTKIICSGIFRFVSISEITFDRTITTWNSILKSTGWDRDTDNVTIICTDGKLDLSGNEIE